MLADCDDDDAVTARHLRSQGFRRGDGPPLPIRFEEKPYLAEAYEEPEPDHGPPEGTDPRIAHLWNDRKVPDETAVADALAALAAEDAEIDDESDEPEITREYLMAQSKEWQIAKLRELDVPGRSKLKTEAERVDAILDALA